MNLRVATVLGLVTLGVMSALSAACEGSSSSGSDPLPVPDAGAGFDAGQDSSTGPPADAGPVAIACTAPTAGPTMHSGEVKDGEIWTAAGSPHIVDGDVNVRDGHTLTIEPCARVQLAKDKGIRVAYPLTPNTGKLIAEGNATHPIWFERQATGDAWSSLYVTAPGTARLAYVNITGGGAGSFDDGASLEAIGDGVLPADPTLFLDHVTIKGSAGTGLYMRDGATFIAGSAALTVTGSGGALSPFAAEIDEHSMDLFPSGSYTGNTTDEVLLRLTGIGVAGVGLTVDATLHDRGVPYRVGESFIVGGKSDAPLATMTIEPGVMMRFVKGTSFNIEKFTGDQPAQGAVRALGTAAKPIVFTSAEAAPAAGDWQGLWFGMLPSAQNRLDHTRIEYAGGSCLCSLGSCSDITRSEGAVVLTNQAPGPFITNTVFKQSAQHGVMEGFTGTFVNFRPTNTFDGIVGCPQTLPLVVAPLACADPRPACD